MKDAAVILANRARLSVSMVLFCTLSVSGCGDTPAFERRDDLRLRLTESQSALARYEAEHREWSTETIAKMKKFLDDMQVAVVDVAKQDGAKAVATFLEGQKTEFV